MEVGVRVREADWNRFRKDEESKSERGINNWNSSWWFLTQSQG